MGSQLMKKRRLHHKVSWEIIDKWGKYESYQEQQWIKLQGCEKQERHCPMAIKEFGNGVNQVTKIGLKSGEVWETL